MIIGEKNEKYVSNAEWEIRQREGRNRTLIEETIPTLELSYRKAVTMVERQREHAEVKLVKAETRLGLCKKAVIRNAYAIVEMQDSIAVLKRGDTMRETHPLKYVEDAEERARDNIGMYTRGNSITVKSNAKYGY